MLRAARRLGREHLIDVVTTFLGAHAMPPRRDRQGQVHRQRDRDAAACSRKEQADAVGMR